jgi:hypothetical protein
VFTELLPGNALNKSVTIFNPLKDKEKKLKVKIRGRSERGFVAGVRRRERRGIVL